jgi:hypothetical protein
VEVNPLVVWSQQLLIGIFRPLDYLNMFLDPRNGVSISLAISVHNVPGKQKDKYQQNHHHRFDESLPS